jgi:hypothetical protein
MQNYGQRSVHLLMIDKDDQPVMAFMLSSFGVYQR